MKISISIKVITVAIILIIIVIIILDNNSSSYNNNIYDQNSNNNIHDQNGNNSSNMNNDNNNSNINYQIIMTRVIMIITVIINLNALLYEKVAMINLLLLFLLPGFQLVGK